MTTTRRELIRQAVVAGAGLVALSVIPSRVWASVSGDRWYYDALLGVWLNDGASRRVLRRAERRAGVLVREIPWPRVPAGYPGETDFGRLRRAGACAEWGWYWTDPLAKVEAQIVDLIARSLRAAGPDWYVVPHLRLVPARRLADRGIVAFYGASPA